MPPQKRRLNAVGEQPETLAEAQVRLLRDVLEERRLKVAADNPPDGVNEIARQGDIDAATVSHWKNGTVKRLPQTLDRIFAAYASASGETATALRNEWLRRVGEWIAAELNHG